MAMSAQALKPGAKPVDGGIDYTFATQHIDIDRWIGDEEDGPWWALLVESSDATIAAMPAKYRHPGPRFE